MDTDGLYLLYRLLKLKGVGPVCINTLISGAATNGPHPGHISNTLRSTEYLRGFFKDAQLSQISQHDPGLSDQLSQLSEQGAQFISLPDEDYPEILLHTLGRSSPPILSCVGNTKLLGMPSAGFCGSRQASARGLGVASDCAEQLVKGGVVLVSGYAAGVDEEVHIAALEHGGSTIVVLPTGLLRFRVRKRLRPLWDWERVLVISEFLPDAAWTVSRAMQRNKTIIGLSRAMVLIEAGKNGGSFDAGRRALDFRKRLHAPVYEGMPSHAEGNQTLISRGACPLYRSRNTGKANITQLMRDIEHFEHERVGDLGLFLRD